MLPGKTQWKHVRALDGLRGVAILLVMLVHFVTIDPAAHSARSPLFWVGHLVKSGWVGVDLFFVLSGFLITGILRSARGKAGAWRNFYVRRVLRIFPLYYAVLGIAFGAGPLFAYFRSEPLRELASRQLWLWLYGTNFLIAAHGPIPYFNHFWSLAVEEHFYLLWPLLILWLPDRTALRICGAVIVGAFAARLGLVAYHFRPFGVYVLTPCRIDELAIGSAIAIFAGSSDGWRRLLVAARVTLPVAFAGALCVAIGAGGLNLESPMVQIVGIPCLGLGFGASLILACTNVGLLRSALESSPLCFLGKYSYGLYLYHPIVGVCLGSLGLAPQSAATALHSYLLGGLACVGASFLCSLALALVSWHVFEGQVLKLKRYFEYDRAVSESPEHFAADNRLLK